MAINKDIMKLKLDLIILIRYEFSNFLIILYNKTMGCINASEAQTPLNKRNNQTTKQLLKNQQKIIQDAEPPFLIKNNQPNQGQMLHLNIPKAAISNSRSLSPIEYENERSSEPVLQALLYSTDRRSKFNKKLEYPFDCIGLLYFSNIYEEASILKQYVATGFLISSNIVVTAAHYIQLFKKIGNGQMKFLIRSFTNESFTDVCYKAKKIVRYSIHNDYDSFNKNIYQDYALAYLGSNIERLKYIRLAANFNQPDAEALVYGFSHQSYKEQFKLIGMKGIIKQKGNNTILYDIDTTMGQSGSPIMVQYFNKEYVAIGVHSGKDSQDKYNSGCLITNQFVNSINLWLNQIKNTIHRDILEADQSLLLKFSQISSLPEKIPFIDLEKSTNNIFHELKMLKNDKIQRENEQPKNNQSTFDSAIQAYVQQRHHQSLVYAQKSLKGKQINKKQRFQIFSLIGLNYYRLLQFELALYYYSESLNCQLQLNNANKPIFIKTLNSIGATFLELNQTEKAKRFFKRAKRLSKSLPSQKEDEKLQNLMNQGSISISDGNIIKAYNLFKSAKILSFKFSSEITKQKALIMNNLAVTTFNLKKYDEWLQYSYACLWILKELELSNQPQYLNWSEFFMKQANNYMQKAQQPLLLKFGRIWKLLELSQQGLDSSIKQSLQNIFNFSQKGNMIQ